MEYQIILKPSAEKQLDKLPQSVQGRVLNKMEELRHDPRPPGAVKLSGAEELWHLRLGDYRIVYEIHDDKLIVLVLRVAHRKDVYRGI